MGGSPTSSLKRRASAARDTPASRRERGDGPRGAGSWCSSRSAGRPPGRRWRGTTPGPRASGRANQARSAAISSRSSSRSSTASWPGSSCTISAASRATSGWSQSSAAQDEQRRQRVEQPPADLAVERVGAGEQHRRAAGAVAPGAHAEAHHVGSSLAVGRRADLAGVDDDLRRRGRVVGDRVRLGSADDGDVAAAERTGAPSSGTTHASPRTRATTVSGASSWMRSDHGGSMLRAQQERRPRPRSVEQSGDRIHRPIVDACAWMWLISYGSSCSTRLYCVA